MKGRKGGISEYIIRILTVLGLLVLFFVFSFLLNLRGCIRGSDVYRTYDKYSYLLESATDQILESSFLFSITVSDKRLISEEKLESLKSGSGVDDSLIEIVPDEVGPAKYSEAFFDTQKKFIILSLEDAIALWAQYQKFFGKSCSDFKDKKKLQVLCSKAVEKGRRDLKEKIIWHLSSELCGLEKSIGWHSFSIFTSPSLEAQSFTINNRFFPEGEEGMPVNRCDVDDDVLSRGGDSLWAPCDIVSVVREIPLFASADEDFVYLQLNFYDCALSREFYVGESDE